MRISTEYRTASVDTYSRFCLTYPELGLSYKQWSKILYDYSYTVRDYMLDSGDKTKLPFGIGYFAIAKKRPKKHKTDPNGKVWINLAIDWKKTKEEGKYMYLFNNHTDGYRYKWKWFYKTARFLMAGIWNFKPYRDNSRKLAEYIKKPNSKYSEIYKEW